MYKFWGVFVTEANQCRSQYSDMGAALTKLKPCGIGLEAGEGRGGGARGPRLEGGRAISFNGELFGGSLGVACVAAEPVKRVENRTLIMYVRCYWQGVGREKFG